MASLPLLWLKLHGPITFPREFQALSQSTFFATGVGAPEGPVALPDGSLYVTEMSAGTLQVTHLGPGNSRRVVLRTWGRPNGLAIDGDGMIWIAEAGLRALIRIAPDGQELLRIEGDGSERFRFPNDLAFGPDGHLYMTDSGLALDDFLDGQDFAEGFMDLDWDGRVYEIDPKAGKVVRVIDRGIRFTNGIAFDAEGRLYANASFPGDVYRYEVLGAVEPKREYFGNVLQPDEQTGFKGPDGMKFGSDGRLYCTVYGQRNVTVLARDGSVDERLMLQGEAPTNCAFARDGQTLLVTEVSAGRVEALSVPCRGLPLHYPTID
ncbi:SMP-30/gluconolactonase/LRE family protein [Aureimonas phyllosphaerae]|uniref:SMP-30/gluconolactonase/LRE family protein n=1 Tax=Aureimonas phyllosphaerae TaxID=1166078 RepID=UPI003A5BFCB5